MKKMYLLLTSLLASGVSSQVGINSTNPTTTLEIVSKSPATKVEGLLIPKLTGDQIFNMPISQGTHEGNLVYATAPASISNQTGIGINLKVKGFFYWDGTAWVTMDKSTTWVTNILSVIKPMNFIYGDNNDFPEGGPAFQAPPAPALRLLNPSYGNSGGTPDLIIENNPLTVQMWNNATSTIQIPAQLKGYSITVNISLKYREVNSNSLSTRMVALTGNTVTDASGFYVSGGTKIKDVFFKQNPSNGFPYVRDELVLSPVIITQEMIDHGIKIFLGSTGNSPTNYYEPALTVDYQVVNTTL